MSTRIDGVNVTVLDKLNIDGTVYVGGNELALSDIGAINPTDAYTNLTELAVDRLFFNGIEVTGTGAAIPSSFRGTKLKNVNVKEAFALSGQVQWTGDYTQTLVRFTDTDPDYLEQSGNIGISSDISEFTFSAWVEFADVNGRHRLMTAYDSVGVTHAFMCQLGAGPSDFQAGIIDNAGTIIASLEGTGGSVNNVLYHVMVSYSSTEGIFLYVDDVLQDSVAGPLDPVGFSVVDSVYIGTVNGALNFLDGCLSDIWFDDTYIDLSVEANRRKFSTSAGTPTDLGANGELPTGSQPRLFFGSRQEAADWNAGTNLGSGGAFTMTGAVIPCDL